MRVALIGYGRWGKVLARNLAQLRVLRTICDPDQAAWQAAYESYPGCWVTDDVERAIESADAVVVATPIDSHAAVARAALERRRHVLVEKPATKTYADAVDLSELARTVDRVVMAGHVPTHDARFRAILGAARMGAFGQLTEVEAYRTATGAGDVLYDLVPHDLAVARTIVAPATLEVRACVQESGDLVEIHLAAGGTEVAITAGWSAEKHRWVSVTGTQGDVTWREPDRPRHPEPLQDELATFLRACERRADQGTRRALADELVDVSRMLEAADKARVAVAA